MGNCLKVIIDKFREKRSPKKDIVLLMTGLDNSGKTLVLNRINNDPEQNVLPTMGFRVVSLKHKLYSIKVYDVGGAAQIRSIWKKYYNDIHGLIYVVDASDMSRLAENKIVFGELISHENIAGKPILLLANKQDVTGSIDELDLVENLDVERVANSMRCPTRVETCTCVMTQGQSKSSPLGIINGFKWLLETISKNYAKLDDRIKSSQHPAVVNNHVRRRPSMTSITPSISSIHSNPFKPIRELVTFNSQNSLSNGKHNEKKKAPLFRKFMKNNKTAPMLEGQIESQSHDASNDSEDIVEPFHIPEDNDRIPLVTLDPLNLINHQKNHSKPMRPFTAPQLSYKDETKNFTMPVIPGQVPQ